MSSEIETRIVNFRDLLVVTAILFGEALYTSTLLFLELARRKTPVEPMEITVVDNHDALLRPAFLLAVALAYLRWRDFDFFPVDDTRFVRDSSGQRGALCRVGPCYG